MISGYGAYFHSYDRIIYIMVAINIDFRKIFNETNFEITSTSLSYRTVVMIIKQRDNFMY